MAQFTRLIPQYTQPQQAARLSTADGFYYASIAGDKYLTAGKLPGISAGKLANTHGLAGELILGSGQTTAAITTVSSSWSILMDYKMVSQANLYPYMMGISGAANAFALAPRHNSYADRAAWYDGTTLHDSGLSFPLGEMHVLGLTYNSVTNLYSFFKNGLAGNTATGVSAGTGNWQFASANLEGSTTNINLLAFSDKCVSASRMRELTGNLWQVFQPRTQTIHVVAASGTTLILADATHPQSADNIALTQNHFLAMQDALSAHLADAVVLTQAHNITLADMLHAQAADNIALSQVHAISVFDASHTHSADGVILTQAHSLTLQDALHPHLADAIVLGAAGTLTVSDGLHAHLADGVVLTQQHVLLLQGADHAHATDTIALTQAHNLTLADALHAQIADNVVFSGGVTLVLADAAHPHAADSITLSVAYSLAIQDAIHATLADNLALGQVHQLIVSDALHAMLAGNIAFSVIPTPDSRVLLIKAENRVLVVAREERTITIH